MAQSKALLVYTVVLSAFFSIAIEIDSAHAGGLKGGIRNTKARNPESATTRGMGTEHSWANQYGSGYKSSNGESGRIVRSARFNDGHRYTVTLHRDAKTVMREHHWKSNGKDMSHTVTIDTSTGKEISWRKTISLKKGIHKIVSSDMTSDQPFYEIGSGAPVSLSLEYLASLADKKNKPIKTQSNSIEFTIWPRPSTDGQKRRPINRKQLSEALFEYVKGTLKLEGRVHGHRIVVTPNEDWARRTQHGQIREMASSNQLIYGPPPRMKINNNPENSHIKLITQNQLSRLPENTLLEDDKGFSFLVGQHPIDKTIENGYLRVGFPLWSLNNPSQKTVQYNLFR